jgi:hypothetical protein
MANPVGLVQIPCGPVDENQSSFLAPPGTFASAINASIARDGTYEPRKGFQEIEQTSPGNDAQKAFGFQGQLYKTEGVYLRRFVATAGTWKTLGQLGNAYISRKREFAKGLITQTLSDYDAVDVDIYRMHAWVPEIKIAGAGKIYWELREIATDGVVTSGSFDGDSVRLCVLGRAVYAVYNFGTALSIAKMDTSVTTPAWGAAVVVTSKYEGPFDACTDSILAAGHIFVAYTDNPTGAAAVGNLSRYSDAVVLEETRTTDVFLRSIGVCANGSDDIVALVYGRDLGGAGRQVWTAAYQAGTLSAVELTPEPVAILVGDIGRIATHYRSTANRWWFAWEEQSTASYTMSPNRPAVYAREWSTGGTISASSQTTYHVGITSRPWEWDSNIYIVLGYQQPTSTIATYTDTYVDANHWVVKYEIGSLTYPPEPVAVVTLPLFSHPRMSKLIGGSGGDPNLRPCNVTAATATSSVGDTVQRVVVSLPSAANGGAAPAYSTRAWIDGLTTYDFEIGGRERGIPYRWQDTIMFDGGTPMFFDGDVVREAGFLIPPRVDNSNTAGTTFSPGQVRYYRAIYRIVDARGRVHLSAPSQPNLQTTSAGAFDTVVRVDSCPCTYSRDLVPPLSITADVYRTTDTGSVYYYVNSVILNSSGAYSNFTDTTSDTALVSAQRLPTTGGILSNYPPSSCRAMCVHLNRIYWVPDGDPWTVQAGKIYVQGEGPTWATTDWVIGGIARDEIKALASIGQRLYVLRADSVDVLVGVGPGDTGANNDWQDLVTVATVGCAGQKTVVETPSLTMWATDYGWIYGVDQAGQIGHYGKQLLDTTSGVKVQSATWVADERAIVFALYPSTLAVFWPHVQQWTTWTFSRDFGGTPTTVTPEWVSTFPDLTTGADRLLVSSRAGIWWQRTISRADPGAGTYVTMTLTTAWMSPGGVQGQATLGRVGLLSSYSSACSATLAIQYDYAATNVTSVSWDAAAIASIVSGQRVQLGAIGESLQISQSFRLIYGVSCTNTSGYGIRLHGITAEVQADQGLGRIPTASMR